MAFIKCSGGGGLRCKTGIAALSTTNTTDIIIGFKPLYLATKYKTSNGNAISIYNSDYSTTVTTYADISKYVTEYPLGNTSNYRIKFINNDGFTMNKAGSSSLATLYWFAAG